MFQDLQTGNFQSLPQLLCLPKHTYFYAKEVIFLFCFVFVLKDWEKEGQKEKKYLAHFGKALKYVALQCTDPRRTDNAGGGGENTAIY